MAKVGWLKKISRLKRLIADVGPLWPEPSTKLAGYATDGPYHCEDCIFLKGRKEGEDNIFRDKNGLGRCSHPVMIADDEVEKDEKSIPIVDIEKGCCEWVTPPKKQDLVQIQKS
jgi:hypothetical protein